MVLKEWSKAPCLKARTFPEAWILLLDLRLSLDLGAWILISRLVLGEILENK